MGELGENEKQLHYEVGQYVAESQIDMLFCSGTLSEEMAKGAKENGNCQVYHFGTKEEMLSKLLETLRKEDTVLVKASHFMNYPEIVEAIKNYKK